MGDVENILKQRKCFPSSRTGAQMIMQRSWDFWGEAGDSDPGDVHACAMLAPQVTVPVGDLSCVLHRSECSGGSVTWEVELPVHTGCFVQ